MQLRRTSAPIEPVAAFANISQPSSTLLQLMHPSNTLPGPHVSFAANPSAFSPVAGSLLLQLVQFRIRLYEGQSAIFVSDEARRAICKPESRLPSNLHNSMIL